MINRNEVKSLIGKISEQYNISEKENMIMLSSFEVAFDILISCQKNFMFLESFMIQEHGSNSLMNYFTYKIKNQNNPISNIEMDILRKNIDDILKKKSEEKQIFSNVMIKYNVNDYEAENLLNNVDILYKSIEDKMNETFDLEQYILKELDSDLLNKYTKEKKGFIVSNTVQLEDLLASSVVNVETYNSYFVNNEEFENTFD